MQILALETPVYKAVGYLDRIARLLYRNYIIVKSEALNCREQLIGKNSHSNRAAFILLSSSLDLDQPTPNLKGILELRERGVDVIRDIGTKYEDFGVFLLDDLNGTRVDALKEQYRGDSEKIIREIIKEWLKGPVSWEALETALRKTGLVELAKHLNETLKYL